MEAKKTLNNQGNPEQKVWCWRYYNIWLQTAPQNNKNSMIVAYKQTWKPLEQNRRPRHKLRQLQTSDFSQKSWKSTLAKRQPLQQMFVRKVDICM
jgi:hypothetical protein